MRSLNDQFFLKSGNVTGKPNNDINEMLLAICLSTSDHLNRTIVEDKHFEHQNNIAIRFPPFSLFL
jgi:hypothetical protein